MISKTVLLRGVEKIASNSDISTLFLKIRIVFEKNNQFF